MDSKACRQALEQVLQSRTFSRSEQLRNFLRYVCEMEISGRGAEIKEYLIGVEVFGKPADYTPTGDATVRKRAFELRQKLQEFYESETPGATLQIDMPKGSYVPQFVERVPIVADPEPASETVLLQPQPIKETIPPRSISRWTWLAAGLACGIVAGALVMWKLRPDADRPSIDPVLREAWGPMLAPQSSVLICASTGAYMTMRPVPFAEASQKPAFIAPSEINPSYERFHGPLPEGTRLFMRPADNVVSIGTVSGIAAANNLLRIAGASVQILPEHVVSLASFRGRNAVLFGDSENSQVASQLEGLAHVVLTIGYNSDNRRMIRDLRQPAGSKPLFSRKNREGSGPAQAYGLITVMPSQGVSGRIARTIIISGVSNAGLHGAAEFLSNPDKMRDLRSRLIHDGYSGFPDTYQIVVRCLVNQSLLVSSEYATHAVIGGK